MTTPDQPPAAIGLLTADRPCISCGFNLLGQPVAREPHYQMLMMRCPECGTPASLQEYPVMGVWAKRWGFMLAALWLLACVLFVLITSTLISSTAASVTERSATPGSTRLVEAYRATLLRAEAEQMDPTVFRQQFYGVLDREASVDAYLVDHPALGMPLADFINQNMQDLRSTRQVMFDATGLRGWITISPFLFLAGMLAAVVLLHHRLLSRVLVVCVPVLILAGVFVLYWHFADPTGLWNVGWGGMWSRTVIAKRAGLPLSLLTVGFAAVPLFAGLATGRPLARLLVRISLPPRLRVPFAALWLADAKPLPHPVRPAMWTRS